MRFSFVLLLFFVSTSYCYEHWDIDEIRLIDFMDDIFGPVTQCLMYLLYFVAHKLISSG